MGIANVSTLVSKNTFEHQPSRPLVVLRLLYEVSCFRHDFLRPVGVDVTERFCQGEAVLLCRVALMT